MTLREEFIRFDDDLASHGVPPLTDWWRDGIGRWLDAYEQRKVLELTACAGRGAAKSTALYKLATFFTCFVDIEIPVGEMHYAIVLSRLKEEAAKGLSVISSWLHLLEIEHRVAGDVVELVEQPRGIRVVAASVAAASGFRAFAIFKDERSKWPTSEIEEQDAEEIDTSAAMMTATHADAPTVTVGSAWGAFGAFYDAVVGGDTSERIVLGPAATWIAAPHISAASMRKKIPDPKRFEREAECKFQGGISCAIDVDGLRACIGALPPSEPLAGPSLVLDTSGGRFDGFVVYKVQWHRVLAVGQWNLVREGVVIRDDAGALVPDPNFVPESAVLRVECIFYERGKMSETWSTNDVAKYLSHITRHEQLYDVYGDQHAQWAWIGDFARYGMKYTPHTWDNASKNDAVVRLRQLIRERKLSIAADSHAEPLIDEARRFVEKMTPSGLTTFAARRGTDDRVMALALLAYVDSTTGLRDSPLRIPNYRHEAYA